ncbi:hypothetical protein RHGRI_011615 [Rhododendron griersonianum]|uniref:Uncharacterized protein n=1 Tax=Rhododendron griersonianum TaxID=479676 RepID=A0AAV6KMX2_9ERIC|nr:hypothetical protein RHGRI_011615 [Rhododendron griersonianum]
MPLNSKSTAIASPVDHHHSVGTCLDPWRGGRKVRFGREGICQTKRHSSDERIPQLDRARSGLRETSTRCSPSETLSCDFWGALDLLACCSLGKSKGTVPALQQEGEGDEDELDDDDDDMSDIPHGNGGGDLLSNIGKMGVSVGDLGSRQAFSALHSMPGMHKDQEIVEDFESLVEDSVGLGVGSVLCPSNIGAHEQPFDIETQRCEQVQIDKRTDGDHYTEDRSENQLEQTGSYAPNVALSKMSNKIALAVEFAWGISFARNASSSTMM